ncbi:MAG: DUF2442 domain-containing protein [Chloroflexi bacterium]|nr:MAG: DUF2442 domain-containing protein [Chloroflexota bacterium]
MSATNQPIPQVTKVTVLPDDSLSVHFDTGVSGRLILSKHLQFTGYFAPLAQREFFRQVYVDHGTLCWPGAIDLDPVVVYAWAMGIPLELAGAPVAHQ